jgi:hypothetical protein
MWRGGDELSDLGMEEMKGTTVHMPALGFLTVASHTVYLNHLLGEFKEGMKTNPINSLHVSQYRFP